MSSITKERLRYLCGRIFKNGERCVYECLDEIVEHPACFVPDILEKHAQIDPVHVIATGADKFPPRLVAVPKSDDGGEAA